MIRAALVLVTLTAATALAEPATERRWALVIGANRGLAGEEPLRFAEDDARRVLEVFEEVGGVEPALTVRVLGADVARAREAIAALEKRLAAEAKPNDRLVVYASAHGGEGVLHLSGAELPLRELVDFVQRAPVGVGLLVVDSCRSGAMTRLKGLKPVDGPPVQVQATEVEGRVLITASGADEYAQESDELGGSYFTHHFLTGLRGAADSSHDGRVTLDEAYAWAFSRTLESTFASRGGLQRPGFKIDLRGQGELVLSEPGSARGQLVLGSGAPGRWLVLHAASGAVVAEMEKGAGPATLALQPGEYRVRLRAEDGWLERTVNVPATGGAVVRGPEAERSVYAKVALKGAPRARFAVSASASMATGLVADLGPMAGAAVGVRRDSWPGFVNQLGLSFAARTGGGVQHPVSQTELELRAGAAHRFERDRLGVALGVQLGAVLVLQSNLPYGPDRTGLEPTALAEAELRYRIAGPFEAFLQASVGAAAVKKLAGTTVVPRGSGSLGIAWSL